MSYIDMPQYTISVQEDLEQICTWLIDIIGNKDIKPEQISLDFKNNSIRLYFSNEDTDDDEYSDESC